MEHALLAPSGWQQPYSFDWYAFTPEISRDDFIDLCLAAFPSFCVEPGRGRLGYSASDVLCDPSGAAVLQVFHSGGSECHVQATGRSANLVTPWIRANVPHLLSRCDLALDYLDADFDHMTSLFLASALSAGVKSRYIGPPPGQGDTESGRTIYLGSRASAGMFRVYEKGKQLKCPENPRWVRVEYEFKPQNVEARRYFSSCPVVEITGTTKISRSIFPLISVEVDYALCPAGSLPTDPEWSRTLRHLKKQYQKAFQRILHDLDFDPVAFVNVLISDSD